MFVEEPAKAFHDYWSYPWSELRHLPDGFHRIFQTVILDLHDRTVSPRITAETPLGEIELSSRLRNILVRLGVRTYGDFSVTKDSVLKRSVPGVGSVLMQEIQGLRMHPEFVEGSRTVCHGGMVCPLRARRYASYRETPRGDITLCAVTGETTMFLGSAAEKVRAAIADSRARSLSDKP